MKKHDFLNQLNDNLKDRISEDDIKSIILDYDEIFQTKKATNMTEDEISNEIGSPMEIAKNILDNDIKQQINPENKINTTSIGKRLLAFIIDSIISLLPLIIVTFIFRIGISNALWFFPFVPSLPIFIAVRSEIIYLGINLSVLFVFWFYNTIIMIILKNKTIGMLLLKIEVVKLNYSPIKITDIFIRQFIGKLLIPSLTCGLSNVFSFVWALLSKNNMTIHDKISNTIVVDSERKQG